MSYLFPSPTITFDAALRDLASGSAKARAMAAHALGDVGDPVEKRRAFDALVRALDDDRPEVRAEAASSLGTLGEADALPHLVKRLDDGAAPVRQNAAIALGTLGLPEAFEPLLRALQNGAADLRFQAATSLAEIDPARAFEPIAAALGDADPQVIAAAALALGAIGGELPDFAARAKELLAPLVSHADGAARFDIAYALAELRDPAGRAALEAALADEGRAWDAVHALGWLGAKAELERAIAFRKVPQEAAVRAAGELLRLDPEHPGARRVLVDALRARKVTARGLAVEQLGAHGGAWAKEPLQKAARTGKGREVADAIAAALEAIEARHVV